MRASARLRIQALEGGSQDWNKGPTRAGEALLPGKTEALTAHGPSFSRNQDRPCRDAKRNSSQGHPRLGRP